MTDNSIQIKNVILDFLNNPTYFEDPYEIATHKSRRGASNQLVWASGDDNVKIIHSPKIQVKISSEEEERIAGSTVKYHTQKRVTINIYYYNKKGYKYIYSGTEYLDSDQNILLRTHIREKIREYADTLSLHLLEFSTIDEPAGPDPSTSEFIGLLQVSCNYYGNVGI